MESGEADTAFRVADQIRGKLPEPWEVYGERVVGHEIHLVGRRIEMVRSPIRLEGYGLRVLRPRTDHLGVGFVPATDLSEAAVNAACEEVERSARYARFPVTSAELPGSPGGTLPDVQTVDRKLWAEPLESLNGVVTELTNGFDGRKDVAPSFGSVKATLTEVTLANSGGLQRRFRRNAIEFELAVKATGGPEGAPPGEFWTLEEWGALPSKPLGPEIDTWCHHAEQVRHAKPSTSGPTTVLFPPNVLADFVPAILGFRFSGGARVREMMPEPGTALAGEGITLWDDGLLADGLGSAPCDDEGNPHQRRKLIDRGSFVGGLYDVLHGQLYHLASTGNGHRRPPLFGHAPRFYFPPDAGPTTLVIDPGDGGPTADLLETVGEGVWLEQFGYPFPDPISGHFGGEIRLGYRISRGKLAGPIRGGTLGGPLLMGAEGSSVLRSVSAVGSESRTVGSLRTPPLVAKNVMVAGGP